MTLAFKTRTFLPVGGFLLLLHCGGATRVDPASDGGATSATGTTGSGTTSSVDVGTTTVGAGGSTGSGGMTGSGGGSGDTCTLPKESGPCEAAIPAWWHNPATGVCEPFIYGGCGGNANNFPSLEACQMACSGGQPDMDACAAPGECVLLGASCCGPCDPANVRSFVAVNYMATGAYMHARGCDAVDCAACPPVSEPETTLQYFIATCEAGRCRVVDIRQNEATSCTSHTDCVLRDGANCCEGCDSQGFVSVNRSGALEKLVCHPTFTSCPPCGPVVPSNLAPFCTSGHCGVRFLR
jgi:hypothetical protein